MTLSIEEIVRYYARPEIQRELVRFAKNREIGGRARDDRFFKRPDMIQYPSDISDRVKQGYATFHCSVEHWSNPMALGPELRTSDIDELRTGWDLIIDLDAKDNLDHAKIATIVIVDFLKEKGVTPTIKFSGQRGFHIGIAKTAFPQEVNFSFLSKRYPDITRIIIRYIKAAIKKKLSKQLGVDDPYSLVDVEEGWGNRHLFRMPYSLHIKTSKVSVPIPLFKLKSFDPEQASIDKIKILPFLENKPGEATELVMQALDWDAKVRKIKPPIKMIKKIKYKKPIPEEYFPPCIKSLISGIENGKKRSIFSLITFLKSVNWSQEDIEKKIEAWNKANPDPLSNRFVLSQLKWHERQQREILPANCDSQMFWHTTTPKLCQPENLCKTIKNPVNYAYKKFFRMQKNKSVGDRNKGVSK